MKPAAKKAYVLKLSADNPLTINQNISNKLEITSQGVGKIRKELIE